MHVLADYGVKFGAWSIMVGVINCRFAELPAHVNLVRCGYIESLLIENMNSV